MREVSPTATPFEDFTISEMVLSDDLDTDIHDADEYPDPEDTILSRDEWRESVEMRFLTDDDGIGHPAVPTEMPDGTLSWAFDFGHAIIPSQPLPDHVSHVVWYNK